MILDYNCYCAFHTIFFEILKVIYNKTIQVYSVFVKNYIPNTMCHRNNSVTLIYT